jgi:hypothetical protein
VIERAEDRRKKRIVISQQCDYLSNRGIAPPGRILVCIPCVLHMGCQQFADRQVRTLQEMTEIPKTAE